MYGRALQQGPHELVRVPGDGIGPETYHQLKATPGHLVGMCRAEINSAQLRDGLNGNVPELITSTLIICIRVGDCAERLHFIAS